MFQVSVGSLQHPNIVQTFSTHLVGEELWVLMEPLDGGSLTQIVENLHIAKLVTISPDSQTIIYCFDVCCKPRDHAAYITIMLLLLIINLWPHKWSKVENGDWCQRAIIEWKIAIYAIRVLWQIKIYTTAVTLLETFPMQRSSTLLCNYWRSIVIICKLVYLG